VSGSIGAQDAAPLFVWFPQPSPRTSFLAVQRFWFVVLMAGLGARPGATQARASFGVGAGTVRYSGGTSFSSATFSPAAGFASLNLAADVSGSFASLPGGVWSGQGRGDLWVASGAVFHEWRLGLEGVLAGTSRTGGAWTPAPPARSFSCSRRRPSPSSWRGAATCATRTKGCPARGS